MNLIHPTILLLEQWVINTLARFFLCYALRSMPHLLQSSWFELPTNKQERDN